MNRTARQRASFTTWAGITPAGECGDEASPPPSPVHDTFRPGAHPSPTPTPFPTPTASKMSSTAEVTHAHCDSSSNLNVLWGNGSAATPNSADDKFLPLAVRNFPHSSEPSPTQQQSPVQQHCTRGHRTTLRATPRFSQPPRRCRSPPIDTAAMVGASTQTTTATALTAAARGLIRENLAAVLIASSMMHQAASTIQRQSQRRAGRRPAAATFVVVRTRSVHI